MCELGKKYKVCDCSNKELIGFEGILISRETYCKLFYSLTWKEAMKEFEFNDCFLYGEECTMVSPDCRIGFVILEKL